MDRHHERSGDGHPGKVSGGVRSQPCVVSVDDPACLTPPPGTSGETEIGSCVDAAHRHHEAQAVHAGHKGRRELPAPGDVSRRLHQVGIGGGVLRPQVVLVDVADACPDVPPRGDDGAVRAAAILMFRSSSLPSPPDTEVNDSRNPGTRLITPSTISPMSTWGIMASHRFCRSIRLVDPGWRRSCLRAADHRRRSPSTPDTRSTPGPRPGGGSAGRGAHLLLGAHPWSPCCSRVSMIETQRERESEEQRG